MTSYTVLILPDGRTDVAEWQLTNAERVAHLTKQCPCGRLLVMEFASEEPLTGIAVLAMGVYFMCKILSGCN